MRTYNSKEPTICISLKEFQQLSIDSRVMLKWMEEHGLSQDDYSEAVLQLEQEDSNG